MQIARFEEIKEKFHIKNENFYFYTVEADVTLKLREANEYELLAEEGLKEIYDNEPEGLWEKCLESYSERYNFNNLSIFRFNCC